MEWNVAAYREMSYTHGHLRQRVRVGDRSGGQRMNHGRFERRGARCGEEDFQHRWVSILSLHTYSGVTAAATAAIATTIAVRKDSASIGGETARFCRVAVSFFAQ